MLSPWPGIVSTFTNRIGGLSNCHSFEQYVLQAIIPRMHMDAYCMGQTPCDMATPPWHKVSSGSWPLWLWCEITRPVKGNVRFSSDHTAAFKIVEQYWMQAAVLVVHTYEYRILVNMLLLKPEYSKRIRSITWLLMPRLLALPSGHQEQWYWLWR